MGLPERATDSLLDFANCDDELSNMKAGRSTLGFLTSVLLGISAVASQPTFPTAAGLDIGVYAGLTITGAVGSVYSIEYLPALGQTNTATEWQCLEFLQLPTNPYLRPDKSAPATGKRFYRAVVFAAPTNMVFMPPGTFRMGSPSNEVGRFVTEGPQTAVTLSRGFWMAKYEVTQAEYQTVVGRNPSFCHGIRTELGYKDYGTDLSRPVETIAWEDATNYCGRLTQLERMAGRIPANCVYRLPTEPEWEYACRAWTSPRFNFGEDFQYTNLTKYAWYKDNSGGTTHPVGQKLPNLWGLYDMHGNVMEWCQDVFEFSLPGGSVLDPAAREGPWLRVLRGGGWSVRSDECRSAFRYPGNYPYPTGLIGFRVVLSPRPI